MSKRKHPSTHSRGEVKPDPKAAAGGAPAKGLADEEFVYVPRGKSRGTYIFILALMVFTLIMFVVPYGLTSLFSPRGGADETFMTWEHPRLGAQSVSYTDFIGAKRELARYYLGQPEEGRYDDESTAAFLVAEVLADEAGVEYGERDIGVLLGQSFSSRDEYDAFLRARGFTPAEFERIARRILRVERYRGMLQMAAAVPSPSEVEEAWKERHQQYAFDAIGLEVEPLVAEASAEATDDEALRSWYEARPPRSGAFADDWREATAAVELVAWPVEDEPPAELLARYPLEGDAAVDAAQLARQYYDGNYHTRFVLEEPATDDEGNPKAFLTFEEAEEAALREAPVHRALGLWRDELATRLADGEELDLGTEAAALGLVFVPAGEPLPISTWRGEPAVPPADPDEDAESAGSEAQDEPAPEQPFAGRFVEDAIRRADAATGLSPRVVVERGALVLTHKTAGAPAGPAPFEEVREEVVLEWSKERAGELAVERLEAAHEALAAEGETSEAGRPVVDQAAFEAQAVALGTTVQHRDWFDPAARLPADAEPTALETYTRRSAMMLQLEEGEVSEPELDSAREHAWMLRGAGRREPPELDIEPREYQGMVQMATLQAGQSAREMMGYEALRQTYALRLARGDDGEGEPPEGEPEPES